MIAETALSAVRETHVFLHRILPTATLPRSFRAYSLNHLLAHSPSRTPAHPHLTHVHTHIHSFVSEVAERITGYSGADIKSLIAETALSAVRGTYPQVCACVPLLPALLALAPEGECMRLLPRFVSIGGLKRLADTETINHTHIHPRIHA